MNANQPARGPQTGIAITGKAGEYQLQRWRSTKLGAVFQPPFGGPFATTAEAKAARLRMLAADVPR